MNATPNPAADDERREQEHTTDPTGTPAGSWQAPHADPSTLRSAYAFDGSGPWLYAPDGSGPYSYTRDGRGPYLLGSAPLAADQHPSAGGHGWATTPPVGGHGASAWGATAGQAPRRRRVGLAIGSGIAALAVLGAAGGTAYGLTTHGTTTTSSQSQGTTLPGSGTGSTGQGSGSSSSGLGTDGGTNGFTVPGQGTGTGTGSDTSTQSPAVAATAAQKKGVVTIDTVIGYDPQQQAAGTGMVLTGDGTVLTNNHVIQGATSIEVTDETTGKQYTADVVGSDATNDVAVLKLRDASGLATVALDDDGEPSTGDAVTDVGNAEGTGNLVAAEGTVTATDQAIQVQSESGTGTESLSGLIEVAAQVVSGDSGGPVLDREGEVVGMATAASSGSADVTGYAIPITTAKRIAEQILSGTASGTVTIGLPAFLGVQVSDTAGSTGGVAVAGTVAESGAAAAGIVAGDTITTLDGTAVTTSAQLTELIGKHAVGDRVVVGYTTSDGTAHTATVTLTAGPAA